MRSRLRLALRRLLAVGLGLLIVEVALRLGLASVFGVRGLPPFIEYDDDLGWRNRAGVSVHHMQAGSDVDVGINAEGFREGAWCTVNQSRRRVLVLGDSLVFGWGVDGDRTIGSSLAERLSRSSVWTAGVIGYGTDQERLLLKRLLPLVRPDHVCLVFCCNDALECTRSSAYGLAKPRFELGEDGALKWYPPPRSFGRLADRCLTWRVARRLLDHRSSVAAVRNPGAEWALVRAIVLAMVEDLDGIPLTVLSHEEAFAGLARATDGLDHLHLDSVLRPMGARAFLEGDLHWSEEGHAAVAHALAERLPGAALR